MAEDGPRRGLESIVDGSLSDDEDSLPCFDSPIRSLQLVRRYRIHEGWLLVGLESGEMKVLAQDSDYLRRRLQSKLVTIGIL